MKRKLLLLTAVSTFFNFPNAGAQSVKTSGSRPNIIIINMDDMGYGDTEPYGMTNIATPNFNKAAQQGIRLTNFNAAQPVCSASRASLMTGSYSNRVGIPGALMPQSPIALNPDEETIATVLKKAGYKTAMLGKWHLGSKAPYLPVHYGFESFFGLPYSNDMWPVDFNYKPVKASKGRPYLTLLEGDKAVDTIRTLDDQARLTTLYTEKAVSFINENKKKNFFLYLAHPMPHVPLAVSDKFKGKSELGIFGDVIMELDWSVGEIRKALRDSKIDKKTILIITSDNGPWKMYGDWAGSSAGFREGKGTSFEGGTRVPCIIIWPDNIPAGMVNSELMTNMDILPTVAAACGAALPVKKIDGMNFLPMLTGLETKGPRDTFYYYYNDPAELRAIRYKSWKMVFAHHSGSYDADRGMNGKMGTYGAFDAKTALYDLSRDPGETYDVQNQYPEIVAKILKLAEDAREDLGDKLTDRIGKNVRNPANAAIK
ncbi:sulfatase family protein [Flavobacterium luteolum]|uniref:sulfatase family protein n=1 Tax=Flavobacterium luteolum TaxID=3003259 RepID=UPI00248E0C41|nr:sulfatase [Flavobacterium luteolum]